MILKRITYSWWYLFFSAYWTAYHLGETEEPEGNAYYLLNVLIGLNIFGVMQFLKFTGYNFSITALIIICVLPAIIIPYLSFKKGNRYKMRMSEFEFLKEGCNAKKRYILLILISLWSVLFVAIGGVIRM